MPRKPEGILLLGLIAVLIFSVTAAQATAPIARELPDIRSAIDPSGTGSPAATVLELDDYVLDPDDRDADGVQDPLSWSESVTLGDDNVSVSVSNELQVSIPSQTTPSSGRTTFAVTDQDSESDFVGPVTVKTTSLLAAPVVDDFLHLGPTNSAVPYSWAISEGQTIRVEPGPQPGGGGKLFLSVSTGTGDDHFIGASQVLDASAQANPLAPGGSPVTLKGLVFGPESVGVLFPLGAVAQLEATNLSIDAGLNGMFATALAGFSDWVRVTVTRKYNDGSGDAYTVAIGDLLSGVTSAPAVFDGGGVTTSGGNLNGTELANVSVIGADEVFGFEGITTTDFIGYEDGTGVAQPGGYDASNAGSRANQTTSWNVTAMAQAGENAGGSRPARTAVTSADKPAPTYPGATSGRALKLDFTRADLEGILVSHRGIPNTEYSAGDVLTFSMNVYVDLNYAGGNADSINEGVNGLTLAMALTAEPVGNIGSFNYLNFAPGATVAAANAADVPNGGFQDYTNVTAALHGKWTRHEVSFRVPEIGKNVTGPAGSGNLVDPAGVSAKFLIARVDTDNPPDQTVWVDNLAVVRCPGVLSFAHGAVNAPMVAAGFGATSNTDHILGNSLPAALSRGAVINGNFSTVGSGAAGPVSIGAVGSQAATLASKGWPENGGNTDFAMIASGAGNVSLRFPDPTEFNQALVLSPAGGIGHPTPSNAGTIPANGHPGTVGVNSGFVDMVLSSQSINPGLRVSDVAYADGTGGPSTQNSLDDNVSGVFGVRMFATTNAANPADNPMVNVIMSDADVTRGIVGQFPPQVLPNGADNAGSGVVWGEYTVSGSFISFTSPQQKGFLSNFGGGNAGTIAALNADNPSSQLAQVQVVRTNGGAQDITRTNAALFAQSFAPVLGTNAMTPGSNGFNAAPGRYNTATVYVDEVGLYAVRDSARFYDEDLAAFASIP